MMPGVAVHKNVYKRSWTRNVAVGIVADALAYIVRNVPENLRCVVQSTCDHPTRSMPFASMSWAKFVAEV